MCEQVFRKELLKNITTKGWIKVGNRGVAGLDGSSINE